MFILLVLSFVALSDAAYGANVWSPASMSTVKCFRDHMYDSFFIFRGWRSIGNYDVDARNNYVNAVVSGFKLNDIYAYFDPCYTCGNPAGQVSSFWNLATSNGVKFDTLYFNVDGT